MLVLRSGTEGEGTGQCVRKEGRKEARRGGMLEGHLVHLRAFPFYSSRKKNMTSDGARPEKEAPAKVKPMK